MASLLINHCGSFKDIIYCLGPLVQNTREAPRRVSVAPIPDDFLDPLSLINLFNQKRPSSRQHGLPDARLLRPSGRNPLLRGIFFLRSLRPRSEQLHPQHLLQLCDIFFAKRADWISLPFWLLAGKGVFSSLVELVDNLGPERGERNFKTRTTVGSRYCRPLLLIVVICHSWLAVIFPAKPPRAQRPKERHHIVVKLANPQLVVILIPV